MSECRRSVLYRRYLQQTAQSWGQLTHPDWFSEEVFICSINTYSDWLTVTFLKTQEQKRHETECHQHQTLTWFLKDDVLNYLLIFSRWVWFPELSPSKIFAPRATSTRSAAFVVPDWLPTSAHRSHYQKSVRDSSRVCRHESTMEPFVSSSAWIHSTVVWSASTAVHNRDVLLNNSACQQESTAQLFVSSSAWINNWTSSRSFHTLRKALWKWQDWTQTLHHPVNNDFDTIY